MGLFDKLFSNKPKPDKSRQFKASSIIKHLSKTER